MAKLKVKAQLLIMSIAPVVLAGAIILILTYTMSVSKAVEDAEAMNLQQAQIIEDEFVNIMDRNICSLRAFATSPTVIDYMQHDTDAVSEDELIAYLDSMDVILADGNPTIITDLSGMQIFRTVGKCVDVSEREYFQRGIKGETFVSDVVVSKSTNTRIAAIVVPIYDFDGKTILGIAQRNYDMSDLHDFLAEKSEDAFVADRTGIIAAHSQHEISVDDTEDRSTSQFMTSGLASDTYISDTGKGYSAMISYQKEASTGWTIVVAQNYREVLSAARKSAVAILIVSLAVIAVVVVAALMLSRSFTKPIKEIDAAIEALADGSFHTINGYENRKDEFGNIVSSTNNLMERLRQIVEELKNVVVKLEDSSTDLAQTAGQISNTTDGISEAVQDIAKGATEQADTIQNAVENVNILSGAIQNVANNAETLAGTAAAMDDQSTSSAEQLSRLSGSMEKMEAAMSEINTGIGATNKAVEAINKMVDSITAIAGQTNLLALNASIEAARAGDAGKGFAVVAEEIGKLASESSDTANLIRDEMSVLTDASQKSMDESDKVVKTTQEVKDVLQETVSIVSSLIGGVQKTSDGITTISGLSEECAASKSVIVEAMDSLAAVSQENAASTEETSASMEELNATVNMLAASADTLNGIAQTLSGELEFFKI